MTALTAFIARTEMLINHGPDANHPSWETGLYQLDDLANQIEDEAPESVAVDARLLRQAVHGLAVESNFSVMPWKAELGSHLALAQRIQAVRR